MSLRNRPRILIADDHLLVAEACKKLLDNEVEVVGIVSDGLALLKAVSNVRPDLIILDIGMPGLNGLDACEQIKRKCPAVKIVFLTMTVSADVTAEAFRRGASGYVLKHCTADELCVAVRQVLHGESYLSPAITTDTLDFLLRAATKPNVENPLSSRQREILQLLAEGKPMKEIAYLLHIKAGTVAFHKYKIMDILHIETNAELIEYAIRQHMICAA